MKSPLLPLSSSSGQSHMRLRVVRFQIAQGVYENIITNLPSDEFSLEWIKHIYHLRWGRETSFRNLKHTLGTANFHSKSSEYIGFEILCQMSLYNFCTIIAWEYQVNLSMAIKICFAFLSDHMGSGNVNDLFSRYILPIRPTKAYARHKVPSTSQFRLPFRVKQLPLTNLVN